MTFPAPIANLLRRFRGWRQRRDQRLYPECQTRVTFDDLEVACSSPDGTLRKVAWSELSEVRVWTTSEGPFLPDVFWVLHAGGPKARIIYPQGAVGEQALLEAMQTRLDGFDNEALLRAMASTDDAVFLVWAPTPDCTR